MPMEISEQTAQSESTKAQARAARMVERYTNKYMNGSDEHALVAQDMIIDLLHFIEEETDSLASDRLRSALRNFEDEREI